MTLRIDNATMRRLSLETNGLLAQPSGEIDVVSIIRKLGFVQLDTIQNVSRAHHHILWSRHGDYREPMLDELLSAREHIFEHYTHDASVLPMDIYPMWQKRIRRLKDKIDNASWHKPEQVSEWQDSLIERIKAEGPLSTKDFDSRIKGEKKVWSRPPHKQVLDYLWYTGLLATSHREKFHKYYDMAERVIPQTYRDLDVPEQDQIDWFCRAALKRLAVGSLKEIRTFWEAVDAKEVKAWAADQKEALLPVTWETASGAWVTSYALKDIEDRLAALPAIPKGMKILNPFDPLVRDRERLSALFGFDYKLEVFVPEAKRIWGYYVYPLLEGDRFVGRIEAKADRKSGCLTVLNFWREEGVRWGKARQQKLDAELKRFARLAELETVVWQA
ncbi:winged helix-turn-helix domain-containing protein [Paremcibacter congregatus]|uniref:winged helix-turn-helix domain-containing protein n=1 Tax=Paremcibacter congregatus TaxID=2043170 RepID=UPI003A8F2CC0